MINKIIKYEFKLLKADFSIVILLFSFIMFISFFNSYYKVNEFNLIYDNIEVKQTEKINQSKKEALDIEKEMIANQEDLDENRSGVRSASNVGKQGLNVMLKPGNFANISIGLYDLYPIIYTVNNLNKDSSAKNIENPFALFIGNFDPAFVILYLYPIFIIILSFDLIASEKERGLLKMLLTQSISLNKLVAGKIILRAIVIFGTVILSSSIGLAVSGVNIFSQDNLIKTLILTLIILLYGSFWFVLAILVNSLKTKSVTNAMILSIAWLIFVFIIPSLINLSANSIYPIPSRITYVEAITEASEEARLKGSKILGQFMEDHPELADKSLDTSKVSVVQAMRDDEIIKKTQPINDMFNNQIFNQKAFIDKLKFLSPAIITQEILYDVSGTGINRLKNYTDQLDKFQKDWRSFFVNKIFNSKPVYAKDYSNFPKFNYLAEKNSDIFQRAIFPLIFLFLLSIFIYYLSRLKYNKYSVND